MVRAASFRGRELESKMLSGGTLVGGGSLVGRGRAAESGLNRGSHEYERHTVDK